MADGQFYWCLNHKAVEPYDQCKAEVRLGPYATQEEASQALSKVQQRNEEWDAQDDEDDADSPSVLGG